MSDYYNALPILSYNGIINFILTNRNYGKTWAFKIRAWRRAYKYGKKTIWVRRFDNEAKSAAQTFYRSKDLQRMLRGYTPYDPKTKKGNVKQDVSAQPTAAPKPEPSKSETVKQNPQPLQLEEPVKVK